MNPSNALPQRSAAEVDFPIERVEAEHVSRREFAKFLCLVSGEGRLRFPGIRWGTAGSQ